MEGVCQDLGSRKSIVVASLEDVARPEGRMVFGTQASVHGVCKMQAVWLCNDLIPLNVPAYSSTFSALPRMVQASAHAALIEAKVLSVYR